MAVSEAIYGSTTSYVSSNAYYGFVPQNNIESPENCNSWDGNVNMKETRNGNCHCAMETDDDSRRDAVLVNNYCVIPEVLRGINSAVYYSDDTDSVQGFGALNRQSPRQDAAIFRNRKRNNDGELVFVDSDQFKRLRKGSGNSCTYDGRGFTKDCGLAEVRGKSKRLCVIPEGKNCKQDVLATTESCCWAAGNHSFIVNNDNKHNNLLNGNLKLSYTDNVEYERMLLETHGCSAYHYQRLQSENEIAEAEF